MAVSTVSPGVSMVAAQAAGRSHGAGQAEVVERLQTSPAEGQNVGAASETRNRPLPASGVGTILDKTV